MIFALMLCASHIVVTAEEYTCFCIKMNNASATIVNYDLAKIDKITFSDNQMILTMNNKQTAKFNLSDIDKTYYSFLTTGIESVSHTNHSQETVYNLNGYPVNKCNVSRSGNIYIQKNGNATQKIISR